MTILNERCYICNKVSSEHIETNPGDCLKKNFIRDPDDNSRSLCTECKEAIEETSRDYYKRDGWRSWHTYSPGEVEVPEIEYDDLILMSDLVEEEFEE